MSLQLLAKQMEAKGRGGDSVLVHMTPEEVAGLQKLAESAGGSLSVNPETGLVEANFLKRMLPTLIGLGVGAATLNPLAGAAAGAAVGGYQAKRNKQDVGIGALMGAAGGYGGASLGMGLGAAGATAGTLPAAGTTAVAPGAAATGVGTTAGTAAGATLPTAGTTAATGATQGLPTLVNESVAGEVAAKEALRNTTQVSGAELAAQNMATSAPTPVSPEMYQAGLAEGADIGYGAEMAESVIASPSGADFAVTDPGVYGDAITQQATYGENLTQAGRGFGQMGTKEGQAAFGEKFGMMQAGAAAAPAFAPGEMEEPEEAPVDDEMIVYDYTPGRTYAERDAGGSSAARRYFGENRFTNRRKIKAADYFSAKGGLIGLAEGGDVAAPVGVTGASGAAFDYLMGNAPSSAPTVGSGASQAGLSYLMGQAPASGFAPPAAQPVAQPAAPTAPITDQMYTFDTVTNTFAKNPNYVDQVAVAAAAAAAAAAAERKKEVERRQQINRGRNRRRAEGGEIYAEGGLMGLAKGGMKSGGFVIPADVVSMVGEGNTDAGYSRIKSMVPGASAIKGKDGGQADTVKTHIEGKQPARVAHGEMYVPPETVKRMGGAKKLYAMMDRVRDQATGSKKQIKPVSLKKALA